MWSPTQCATHKYTHSHTISPAATQHKQHWNRVTIPQNTATFAGVEDHLFMTKEINYPGQTSYQYGFVTLIRKVSKNNIPEEMKAPQVKHFNYQNE